MRRNAIARIILYSILALTLTAVLIVGMGIDGFGFHINISGDGTTVEDELTLDAAQIKNVDIDWAAGSVKILVADTDRITVTEVCSKDCKYKMTYKISGSTLELDYGNTKISIGFGNGSIPSKDLIITVPRDWVCGYLDIDGAALEIDIQDVRVGSFELDGASCDVDFVGYVDKVDIDGASTDIHITSFDPVSSVQIDGASCELELTIPNGCGFLVELNGLNYGFHCDLDYSNLSGAYAYGNRQCVVNVDGISCDVTIKEGPSCNHDWGPGMPVVDPNTGWQGMMYSCHHCGESTTDPTLDVKWPTE